MSKEDEFYRSDSRPLHVDLRWLSTLCSVATNAQLLLTAVLDKKPMAKIVQELSVDLNDLFMRSVEQDLSLLEQDFAESNFVRVELDGEAPHRRLLLWSENQ